MSQRNQDTTRSFQTPNGSPLTPTTARHHVRRKSHYPSTISFIFGHFSSLLQYLFRQIFRSNNLPFILTFLWHAYNVRRLLTSSKNYLDKYTSGRKQSSLQPAIAADILKRLGGINLSLALLALLALIRFKDLSTQKLALFVLMIANGTQAWNDGANWRSGRWNWAHLIENGSGDGIIALMNLVAYIVSAVKSKSL
ncbi:1656_t:CDS:1 [Diversispora eburnea]|uniref:1656_t:CDS:1 n=1 Tax=Diversispora eburnea TaxID=1213867 RepID=A0A9N8W6M5_9GLOM|nr:1656_t:CDS:1 [Diversispora eburnea]